MEEEGNPNLANINIDEITAFLQDTVPYNNIIDINGDMNEMNGNMDIQVNNNKNEDIEMGIQEDQDIDLFLSEIVKKELEVLSQKNHQDPISKKAFNDLNDTISKITMTNHIKRKKIIANNKKKNKIQ